MPIAIKNQSTYKEGKLLSIKQGTTYKDAKRVWVKHEGGYKAIFPEEPPSVPTTIKFTNGSSPYGTVAMWVTPYQPPYYIIRIRVTLNVDPPSNRAVVVESDWSLVFNGRVAEGPVGMAQKPYIDPNPTLTIRFN